MCGRFALGVPRRLVAEAMGLSGLPEVPARYNIAPSQLVEAVFADRHATRRRAGLFRWGLVPAWAKDPKIGARCVNARVETVCDKPAFRGAVRYRRCLVPAQGFYEWHHGDGPKTPYFLTLADAPVMVLAGIFEHYTGQDGEAIDSLAILTREATGIIRRLHDRMPLLLPPDLHAAWIDPLRTTPRELSPLLAAPVPRLAAVPVGALVNSPRNDGPELLAPIGPPLGAG